MSIRNRLGRLSGRVTGETHGLARDSLWLGAGIAAGSLGWLVILALITRMLGLGGIAQFSLIESSVALIGQFFDVQSNRATVVFGVRRLERGDPDGAAGIAQLGFLVDLGTGFVAFAILAAVAPFLAPGIGIETTSLLVLHGLTLLISFGDDSAKGILRMCGRFRQLAAISVVQWSVRALGVLAALLVERSLFSVIITLVLIDALSAVMFLELARRAFRTTSGRTLFAPALRFARDERRAMFGMIFHTNLAAYAKLAVTKLPVLILGVAHSDRDVATFRIGISLAAAAALPGGTAMNALHPRMARLWATGSGSRIRRFQAEVTTVSVVGELLVAAGMILLRGPLIRMFAGTSTPAMEAVLVVGVLAYALDSALFWNGAVLLVAGRASVVSGGHVLGALAVLAALGVLVGPQGALGAAAAFAVGQVVKNAYLTVVALRELRARAARSPDGPEGEVAGVPPEDPVRS